MSGKREREQPQEQDYDSDFDNAQVEGAQNLGIEEGTYINAELDEKNNARLFSEISDIEPDTDDFSQDVMEERENEKRKKERKKELEALEEIPKTPLIDESKLPKFYTTEEKVSIKPKLENKKV